MVPVQDSRACTDKTVYVYDSTKVRGESRQKVTVCAGLVAERVAVFPGELAPRWSWYVLGTVGSVADLRASLEHGLGRLHVREVKGPLVTGPRISADPEQKPDGIGLNRRQV